MQPVVRDLRSATSDLAVVTPRLARSFGVLNRFFNILAYDPPGSSEAVQLLGRLGARTPPPRCSTFRRRTGRSAAASCS